MKRCLCGLRVPISAGPLSGMRWSVLGGTRFFRGTYDTRLVEQFMSHIESGDTVYDVGAHIGYYALCAAKAAGPNGRVIAFEPLPVNIAFLKGHLRANNVGNVDLISACVADKAGVASFDDGGGTGRGGIQPHGDRKVETVSLDALCESGTIPPPKVIKMDIEGGETAALRGAVEVLSAFHPTLFLSTHGDAIRESCISLLKGQGYLIESLKQNTLLATRPSSSS